MGLSEQPFSQEDKVDQLTATTEPQSPRKLYLNYRHREPPKAPTPAELAEIIDLLSPVNRVLYPQEQEKMHHEAYAQNRRIAFVGRKDLLRQIDIHMYAQGAKPLVVTGDPGCGKSALLAEWASGWRQKNPEDLLIQHYIGSTPQSADRRGLVRRILGELKRSFTISDELPLQVDAKSIVFQDWLAKLAGKRRIMLVLDGLDQIPVDDPAARQLDWLPFGLPPNARLIVSSAPGAFLEELRARNWPELDVPLFSRVDIAPVAEAYLHLFWKKLPPDILARLEVAPAATNALFLRSVLDELRQCESQEDMKKRADNYLHAPDLTVFFDRVLTRWDDDFNRSEKCPNLVHRSLCLIACTRFGLSETELLFLLGTKSKQGIIDPLRNRHLKPFLRTIENFLFQAAGIFNFGHDSLRAAVRRRWLNDEETAQFFRIQLIEYFKNIPKPTDRKLDELPPLLFNTGQWGQLKDLLADFPTFLRMRKKERWQGELQGYWLALKGKFIEGQYLDPARIYLYILPVFEEALTPEHWSYLLNEIAGFLEHTGKYDNEASLLYCTLEMNEQVLGEEHPVTLACMDNSAEVLRNIGDNEEADPLFLRALEIRTRVLGDDHPDTLRSRALMHRRKGDYAGADQIERSLLKTRERVLGKEHPETLAALFKFGHWLNEQENYEEVKGLYCHVLKGRERVLGPEHPDTLIAAELLAYVFKRIGDYPGAALLARRVLKIYERVLGKEHPDTIRIQSNIEYIFSNLDDYTERRRICYPGSYFAFNEFRNRAIKSFVTVKAGEKLSETASAICRSQEPILAKLQEMQKQRDLSVSRHLDRLSSS
jgi:tetratricopeptide (TPR) repeat protein